MSESYHADDFEPIQLNEAFAEALSEGTRYCPENAFMFQVRPPERNSGLETSQQLLRSYHDFQSSSSFLSKQNVSDICSFEVWYDEQELKFMYYVPDRERERHYRRQIDGHFPGCDIETIRERFVNVSPGEYITGGEVTLRDHYFMPIRNKEGAESWNDPYQMLFSELDTRDEDRALFQILFQPARPDWDKPKYESVDEYAEEYNNEDDNDSVKSQYGSTITNQAGQLAFNVNVRFIAIGETKHNVKNKARNIATRLQTGYREISDQTLITNPYTGADLAELVRKMAAREETYMPHSYGTIPEWKRHTFGDQSRKMVMSITELAGLMHFPKSKEMGVNSINWTSSSVDGVLPYNANSFTRIEDDVREKQLKHWQAQQHKLLEDLGLDESVNSIMKGRPFDDEKIREIIENREEYLNNKPDKDGDK